MGFFDKMKSIKNAVTGGAAKVYIDCESISFSEPFQITIKAQTQDAPVKVSRVYLIIKASEEVEVPDIDVMYDEEGETNRRVETVYASHTTFELEITVADEQELEANQSYQWQTDIQLPASAQAAYRGRFCHHTYRVFAGLDCFGNDPDSGWVDLHS